ncbi:DUF5719 family protein [Homoserinimonas sp. A520]
MPDLHDDEPVLEETQPQIPPAQVPPADAAPRGARARGILVVGARAVTGLIGIAATAATVLAATLLPLPAHQATPPAASVIPVAAPQQRVCAGPMLRLGDDQGGSATVASAVGTPSVRHLATNGAVETSSIGQTSEPSGRSATVLTLAPAQDNPDLQPLLAGSQLQTVDSAGLAGLVAAECVEARAETWLVGGSSDTGRTSLLTLANPGAVAATVSISIYSEDGLVEAPGTEGIVVQPNSETSFSLAGFAPGLVSPVVRVTSVGGTVVAHLQQSTVRILEPGGVDMVGPAAAPSTDVVIPGMVIVGHEALDAKVGAPDYHDITPVLRLFVPGDEAASATIAVTPEGGGDTISVDFDLLPGKVSEFPFEHFEDGGYTVSVTSDVPLVAGARASTVGESGLSDFVWLESAELMREQALVNIGSGADAALHLSNPSTTDAEVIIAVDGAAGETTTVTVPAEGAIAVPVDPGTAYRLSGFTQLRVAVSYTGDGLLAGFTVSPTGPAAERITVYP